jgi:DNA (cytosine-5)-methyltransferase 1
LKLKRRKIVAKQKELKVIELFAGIGAWAKGLITAGIKHKVVAVVEFDKKTIQCYNAIHGTQFEPMDITKLSGDELPDCDMICYSPPCQAFSVAGRQEGFNDVRGILFFDALRIINSKKPKYALMENVKGLTGKKFKNEFEYMLKALEDAGYNNHWKVLNAKDYGIPQNRERVFVVSIRNDIKKDFRFPLPLDNKQRQRNDK